MMKKRLNPPEVSGPPKSLQPIAVIVEVPLNDGDNLANSCESPHFISPKSDHGHTTELSPPVISPPLMSPMRHHQRTLSYRRQIKETLDAHSVIDENGDRTYHRINQYLIKKEIGRGSYGAVHLATDPSGNEYAIKEISKSRMRRRVQSNILRACPHRPDFMSPGGRSVVSMSELYEYQQQDPLFLIRAEVAIMKKLNHPNLVQLIEVLDDPHEDFLYMVLEMCKKGVIMKVGLDQTAEPYQESECRTWFRDLILGIEYLHTQGVVHHDIKPDNLLLTEDDVLKIVDFGVSEMFSKNKHSGPMKTSKSAGSPAFLPPELCVAGHGEVNGKAADIWAMGVTLYCLKYGRLPFEHASIVELCEAITTAPVELPKGENEVFIDLMHRILDKDPQNRITMQELRNHPWVTLGGLDPLLDEEENYANLIELPNVMEVKNAITRKITHLLCVMKVIHKFKSLLTPKGLASPAITARGPAHEKTTATSAVSESHTSAPHNDTIIEAETVNVSTDQNAARGLMLGIGTGSGDDYCVSNGQDSESCDYIVASSPMEEACAFSDFGLQAELARMRQQSNAHAHDPRLLSETPSLCLNGATQLAYNAGP